MPEQQLHLFHDVDATEFEDLVALLVDLMGHNNMAEEIWRYGGRTLDVYKKLTNHPIFKKAEQRRRDKFWSHCAKAAKEVESWPAWKKGSL